MDLEDTLFNAILQRLVTEITCYQSHTDFYKDARWITRICNNYTYIYVINNGHEVYKLEEFEELVLTTIALLTSLVWK